MRVRGRLLVASGLAAALVAGGVVVDRSVGSRATPGVRPIASVSGAWYCPHGGGEGWRVWVALANPSTEQVRIRVATSAGGAPAQPTTETLEPSTLRYLEIPAPLPGTSTAIESFGSEIGASMIATAPEGGVAAEPCASDAGVRWYVPEASTLRGEEARLVVANPFATEAVVDVTVTSGERFLRPGRLQGVVLDPGESKAFELHHFALGESALAATVEATLGRVAVAGVTISNGGVRMVLGVQQPAPTWLLPGFGGTSDLVVRAPGGLEVPFHAELNGVAGAVRVVDLEAVAAGSVEVFEARDADGGLIAQVDGERTMIAGRRISLAAPTPPEEPPGGDEQGGGGGGQGGGGQGGGGDQGGGGQGGGGDQGGRGRGQGGGGRGGDQQEDEEEPVPPANDLAATSGVTAPAPRWLVLPALGPEGGEATLLLQNPGSQEVEASVSFLGTAGPLGEQTVAVPGGSTVRVELPEGGPAAAVVDAGEARIVAAAAGTAAPALSVAVGVQLTVL
jgi:hypothetical protein